MNYRDIPSSPTVIGSLQRQKKDWTERSTRGLEKQQPHSFASPRKCVKEFQILRQDEDSSVQRLYYQQTAIPKWNGKISFEPYDHCRDRDSAIASASASVSVDDSDSYIEGEIFILRRISSNCRRLLQGVYKLKLNAWIYYKP